MARKRDVLHWTPDPIGEALYNLRRFSIESDVVRAKPNDLHYMQNSLANVAVLDENGKFTAWHVTDDPESVVRVLNTDGDLGKIGYLGVLCEGLHVTAVPDMWARHSARRWSFLKKLSSDGKDALVGVIRKELIDHLMTHYITENEYNNAINELMNWQNGMSDYGPRMVGGQPYNVDVPELAKKAGIADYTPADIVPVEFEGRFIDLTKKEAQDEAAYLAAAMTGKEPGAVEQMDVCRALQQNGWDGGFTRSDVSTYPEMAIWNPAAIRSFGDWKPRTALSGSSNRQLMYFVYERPDGKRLEFRIWPRKGEMRDETGRRGLKMYHHLTDDQVNLVKLVSARNIE